MADALTWATRGGSNVHVPKHLRSLVTFWNLLPMLTGVAYVAYVLITRQWFFLLALPVFVVAYQVYHPRMAMILGPLRIAAIAAVFVGAAVSLAFGSRGFTAAFVTLVVVWLSERSAYRVSVSGFLHAAATHDDLFVKVWNAGMIGIWLPDGTKHWADRKYESGRFVRLDQ